MQTSIEPEPEPLQEGLRSAPPSRSPVADGSTGRGLLLGAVLGATLWAALLTWFL